MQCLPNYELGSVLLLHGLGRPLELRVHLGSQQSQRLTKSDASSVASLTLAPTSTLRPIRDIGFSVRGYPQIEVDFNYHQLDRYLAIRLLQLINISRDPTRICLY